MFILNQQFSQISSFSCKVVGHIQQGGRGGEGAGWRRLTGGRMADHKVVDSHLLSLEPKRLKFKVPLKCKQNIN